MLLVDDIIKSPPDATNQEGTKFWLDRQLTLYARNADRYGTALPRITVLLAQTKDGKVTRLIMDGDNWLFESTSYEAIACHIDILKFNVRSADSEST